VRDFRSVKSAFKIGTVLEFFSLFLKFKKVVIRFHLGLQTSSLEELKPELTFSRPQCSYEMT
jgi:hypothetical protein